MSNTLMQRSIVVPRIAGSLAHEVRALLRLAATAWLVMRGVAIVALRFTRLNVDQRQAHIGRWSRQVLHALGVTLQAKGQIVPGMQMLVANHVSWLDVMVLHALCPQARFVAKSDVAHWPLIGRLVAGAQTFLVERARPRQVSRTVDAIAAALQAGATVAVFPEGTTTSGHSVLPFRASLLQAALTAGVPIRPVALRYADARDRVSRSAPYIDDDSLLTSMWRTARAERLVVHVSVLPAHDTHRTDRRLLAAALRTAIQGELD